MPGTSEKGEIVQRVGPLRGASLPAYRIALPKPQYFVILLLQEIGRTALPDGASDII
jgi:hypothetical protein